MKIAVPDKPATTSLNALDNAVFPVTNVAFLLLIFFLMWAQVSVVSSERIELPESVKNLPPVNSTLITLTEGGVCRVESEPCSDEAFAELYALGNAGDECEIIIVADARAEASTLMALSAALQRAGIANVRIRTQLKVVEREQR